MALFAPKLNPADVQLKYTSRIEAVAYPCFERIAPAQMTSGKPEEYAYRLDVDVKSYYRAEGHLHCPGLPGSCFLVPD